MHQAVKSVSIDIHQFIVGEVEMAKIAVIPECPSFDILHFIVFHDKGVEAR